MKRTSMFILALALLVSAICEIAYAQCPGGNCNLSYGWNSYGYGWYWPQWNYQYSQTKKCNSPACSRVQEQKETVPATTDESGEQTVPETPVIEEPEPEATEPVSAVAEETPVVPGPESAVETPALEDACTVSIPAADADTLEFKPFCVRVAELINQARARYGLQPLTLDQNLCNGCGNHSAWMASYGFQHASNAGAMECIAMGVSTPEAVVNMWMNSSGHRAIILSRGHLLGVGAWGTFWTLRVR